MYKSAWWLICGICVVNGRHPFTGSKSRPENFGYVPHPEYHNEQVIDNPSTLPENVLSLDELLDELDWRDYDGQNYCTWTRNQHMPYYCGSCWAFSTTSAMADRFMIRRGNAFPEITIAPQILLDCDDIDYGCHGGDAASALYYIYNNYLTDETCAAYVAKGWDVGRNCTGQSLCENCMYDWGCWEVPAKFYQKYTVSQWGFVSGETKMMAELSRGPIVCAMAVTDEFYYNYTGGVFIDETNCTDIDHLISLVGYGTSNEGIDYWIGRNSWGTFWGEDGFFKIIRGVNNLAIEEACYWMEPDTSNFSHLADYEWARDWGSYDMSDWATKTNVEAKRRRLLEEQQQNAAQAEGETQETPEQESNIIRGNRIGPQFKRNLIADEESELVVNPKTGTSYLRRKSSHSDFVDSNYNLRDGINFGLLHARDENLWEDHIVSPLPATIVADSDLPTEWSWHNVNGTNYLTTPRNQHIPTYCGSCWAFSTTSMVSDRLNIIRYDDDDEQWPEVDLSPQVLINAEYAGDCDGGYPYKAIKYMYNYGLPDETCQIYEAKNNPHGKKTYLNECYNCDAIAKVLWPGDCYQVTDFEKYYVTEYGKIKNNVTEMKKEIYTRGPIACEIIATGSFWHYEGGVYSQKNSDGSTDHVITVVGWSKDEHKGVEYWIARNSWGMYWGEDGFFRIEMYENNLKVEEACYWATVEWNSTNSTSSSSETDEALKLLLGEDDSDEKAGQAEEDKAAAAKEGEAGEAEGEEEEKELTFGEKMARIAVHALM